jgi:drug/metabolite transporter (DMT)-like permease
MKGEWKIILGATLFALIPVGVSLEKNAGIFSLLFGRLFFAALILLLISKNRNHLWKVWKSKSILIFWWSMTMLLAMVCYFFAIRLSGVSISAAILGSQPVLIVLLGALLMREKISTTALLASVMACIGIALIAFDIPEGAKDLPMGIMMALLSALFLSLNFVMKKKYLSTIPTGQLLLLQCLLQLPFLLPSFIMEIPIMNTQSFVIMAGLGLLCTVFAYSLIYTGIKTVSVQRIGILQSVEYVAPVIFGLIFFNEQISAYLIIAVVLILAACAMASVPERKKA